MTNIEWMDLLVKEWSISRSSAKEMLHQMYQIKRYDTLRKEIQNDKGKDCHARIL